MLPITHLLAGFGDATAQVACGTDSSGNPVTCDSGLPQVGAVGGSGGTLDTALTIIFGVVGAIAVLMIVLAALRFVLGQGNPQETAKARNTIIYAAIGLVISLAAEAFVAMVLGKL